MYVSWHIGHSCLLHCQLNHSNLDHRRMGGDIVFLALNVSSGIVLEVAKTGARAVVCLPCRRY